MVFRGPIDGTTSIREIFDSPIEAKVIRFVPISWSKDLAVRLELLGCEHTSHTTTTTTTTVKPFTSYIIDSHTIVSHIPHHGL